MKRKTSLLSGIPLKKWKENSVKNLTLTKMILKNLTKFISTLMIIMNTLRIED